MLSGEPIRIQAQRQDFRQIAMQHQIRNVDVQFIVAREDFDAAVRALHSALVEEADSPADDRAAA